MGRGLRPASRRRPGQNRVEGRLGQHIHGLDEFFYEHPIGTALTTRNL